MPLIAWLPPSLAQPLLRVAYRGLGYWWRIRRPSHTGALVAVHHADRVLLLRQSYQPLWAFPGGTVESGEEPSAAAARELREEVGVDASPADLQVMLITTRIYNYRHSTDHFYALPCRELPTIKIDEREIVEARWCTLAEARNLNLLPHLYDYLAEHEAQGASMRRISTTVDVDAGSG